MYPYAPYARLHGTPSTTFDTTQAENAAREAEIAKNPYYGDTIIYVTDRLYNSPEYQRAVKGKLREHALELIMNNSVLAVIDDVLKAPKGGTLRKEFTKLISGKPEYSEASENKILTKLSQDRTRDDFVNAFLSSKFYDSKMRVLCFKEAQSNLWKKYLIPFLRIINRGNMGEYPMTYPDILSTRVVSPIEQEIRILRNLDTTAASEEEEQSFLMRNKVWIGLGVGALIAVGIYHSRSK